MLKIKTLIFISTILLQVSSKDETKSKKLNKKRKVEAEIADLKRMNTYYSEKVDHCHDMLDSMQQSQITCSKISDDNLVNFNKLFLENEKCNDSNLTLTTDNLQAKKNLQICETKEQSEEACSKILDEQFENVNKLTLENKKCTDDNLASNNEKVEAQKNLQICEDKISEMDDEICVNANFGNGGAGFTAWIRLNDSEIVFNSGHVNTDSSFKKCFKTKTSSFIQFIKLQQYNNSEDGAWVKVGTFYTSRKNGEKMYWTPIDIAETVGFWLDNNETDGDCGKDKLCDLKVYKLENFQ